MKEAIKLSAFVLLIIGTVGLLVNELIIDLGRAAVLTFAVLNIVGLILLVSTQWCLKSRDK